MVGCSVFDVITDVSDNVCWYTEMLSRILNVINAPKILSTYPFFLLDGFYLANTTSRRVQLVECAELTQLDQFIHDFSDLWPKMRHLGPDGINIDEILRKFVQHRD